MRWPQFLGSFMFVSGLICLNSKVEVELEVDIVLGAGYETQARGSSRRRRSRHTTKKFHAPPSKLVIVQVWAIAA